MQRAIARLIAGVTTLDYYLIIFLLVSGGFVLSGPPHFEFSQVNSFGVIFLLLILASWRLQIRSRGLSLFEKTVGTYLSGDGRAAKVLFFSVFSVLFLARILRHYSLNTDFCDVVYLHQPLFHAFTDRLLNCDICRVETYLGEHISFTLLLLAPITSLIQHDLIIFLFKPLLIGSGIFLLLKYGPLKNQRSLWFWSLFLVFCSSALRSNQLWDFREDELAFFFLMLALTSLYLNKASLYVIGLLGAIFTKENYAFSCMFMAVPLYFDSDLPLNTKTRRRLAVFTFITSVVYAIVCMKFIIPSIMGPTESTNNILLRLPGLGSTLGEALKNSFLHPILLFKLISNIFTLESLKYVLTLVLPFIYFARQRPLWLVPAIPGIALNILTPSTPQRMQIFHYELIILPFLIFALFQGVLVTRPTQKQWATALLIALCVFGRAPLFEFTRYVKDAYKIPSVIKLEHLSNDVVTAADRKVLAHLSYLSSIRIFSLPEGPMPLSKKSAFELLLKANELPFAPGNNRLLADARRFVFNSENPWEKLILEELFTDQKTGALFEVVNTSLPIEILLSERLKSL